MPIRPQPRHYHCPACRWSITVHPQSDSLTIGDVFRECPKCGHRPLDERVPNALELAALQLRTAFSRSGR